MLNSYLEIKENSRIMMPEKREINGVVLQSPQHSAWRQYPHCGYKEEKIQTEPRSAELRQRWKLEETEAAGISENGSNKEELHQEGASGIYTGQLQSILKTRPHLVATLDTTQPNLKTGLKGTKLANNYLCSKSTLNRYSTI